MLSSSHRTNTGPNTLLMPAYIHVAPLNDTIYTRIDSIISCEGTLTVPVYINNAYQIKSSSLTITFDTSLMSLAGYQSPNPAIATANLQVFMLDGDAWVTWNAPVEVDPGNGILLELIFEAVPGVTPLTWNTFRPWKCKYYNAAYQEKNTAFIPGYAEIADCAIVGGSVHYLNPQSSVLNAAVSFIGSSGDTLQASPAGNGNFLTRHFLARLLRYSY